MTILVEKATVNDKVPVKWVAKQVLMTDEAAAELETLLLKPSK